MDILNILVSTGLTGVILMILWHFVKNWMEDRDEGHEANRKAIITNANFREAILFLAELSGPKNAKRWQEVAETATNEDVLFVRT